MNRIDKIPSNIFYYTFKSVGKDVVAETFPLILANYLAHCHIINMYGQLQHIHYDPSKLIQFKINLGHAIYSEEFDTLDDIILDFFTICEYKVLSPTKDCILLYKIRFPEEAVKKFINFCNKFKGKYWDIILVEFIEQLNLLLDTATIGGVKLQ